MNDAIARPLAALMAGLHPGWNPAGCAAAIHAARHMAPPHELAHAVIAYAMRADVTTPALLATDGPHWHTGRTPNTRIEPARCTRPGHEYERQPCRLCPVERYEPTTGPTLGVLSEEQMEINLNGHAKVRAVIEGTGR